MNPADTKTFLLYLNKENHLKSFKFNMMVPSMWQELYDLKLLEEQEARISEAIKNNRNKNSMEKDQDAASLKVPLETAIQNLERKTKRNSQESRDKKKLRKDFLSFLKEEVAPGSYLEILFQDLIFVYDDTDKIFSQLKRFQTERKVKLSYLEKNISFQNIGKNPDFGAYSKIYQGLVIKEESNEAKNTERRQKRLKGEERKTELPKKVDKIAMMVIASLLTVLGVLAIVVKGKIWLGLLILATGLFGWWYVYTKYMKDSENHIES